MGLPIVRHETEVVSSYAMLNIFTGQERAPLPASSDMYKPAMPHKYPHPTNEHIGVQVKVGMSSCVLRP